MIPVGGTFTRSGRARKMLGLYTLGLMAVGLAGLTLTFLHIDGAETLGGAFTLGLMLFGWLANAMTIR